MGEGRTWRRVSTYGFSWNESGCYYEGELYLFRSPRPISPEEQEYYWQLAKEFEEMFSREKFADV